MTPDVIGRYQIVRELGVGGMGAVFLAHDPRFPRDVALKLLHASMTERRALRKRFEREAQTIAGLEHHAIVPVYDFGQYREQLYLVMRLMRGGTLKDRLTGGPLPHAETLSILQRMGAALDKAHENGIVHRDLKPANVLFDDEGKSYLSDFGIVKLYEGASRLTQTGGIVGTPAYMSPEQGRGEAVDRRSDVYSLGVVLYEMATGRVPFQADTGMATVLKHVQEPLPPPSDVNPQVPAHVERVIVKALAKRPQDRFGSAGEMVRALQSGGPQAGLAETVVDEAAPAQEEPGAPGCLSLRLLVAGAVLSVLLLAAVVAGGWVLFGQELLDRATTTPGGGQAVAVAGATATTAPVPSAPATDPATSAPADTQAPTSPPAPSPTIRPSSTPAPAAGPPAGQIVFTCFIDGVDNICRMNADGSRQQVLTQAGATDFYASYSPHGRLIVFSSRRSGDFRLYAMDGDGGNLRRIGPDSGSMFAPAVSPDGQQIAFTNAEGERQSIWVMDVDGSNARRLTDDGGDDVDPVWSPDGSQIAFASDRTGDERAHYVMNADGSGMRMLASGVEEIGGRSDWSPDGRWLAFYAGPTNDRDIYLVAADGSGDVRRLTDGGSNLAPAFSPDGGWITFTSYRGSEDPDIYVMRPDGSDVRQLTDNTRPDWQPRWGP